jgi:hypothetical protein
MPSGLALWPGFLCALDHGNWPALLYRDIYLSSLIVFGLPSGLGRALVFGLALRPRHLASPSNLVFYMPSIIATGLPSLGRALVFGLALWPRPRPSFLCALIFYVPLIIFFSCPSAFILTSICPLLLLLVF